MRSFTQGREPFKGQVFKARAVVVDQRHAKRVDPLVAKVRSEAPAEQRLMHDADGGIDGLLPEDLRCQV
jgi:hypothetical protein